MHSENEILNSGGTSMANTLISFLQGNLNVFDDLDSVTSTAISNFILHHGVTTHIYQIIAHNAINKHFVDKLKSHYFAITIRNSQVFQTYRVIVNLFEQHSIPFIPLKGVFLLPVIYNDTAGRNISDIDILIQPQDYTTVQQLLLELGALQEDEGETELLNDLGHHYAPFTLFNTSVEIHSRLLSKNLKYQIAVEDIWKNKERYFVDNNPVFGVDSHSLIAYLALHIHYSEMRGEYRLYWYLDIYKLLIRADKTLSDQFLSLVEKQRIKEPVSKILAKVAYLFNLTLKDINPLSEKEITRFKIDLGGDEKRQNKGYSILFERLYYTKGVFNKCRFLIDTIKQSKQHHQDTNLVNRVMRLAKNTLRYLFR